MNNLDKQGAEFLSLTPTNIPPKYFSPVGRVQQTQPRLKYIIVDVGCLKNKQMLIQIVLL